MKLLNYFYYYMINKVIKHFKRKIMSNTDILGLVNTFSSGHRYTLPKAWDSKGNQTNVQLD